MSVDRKRTYFSPTLVCLLFAVVLIERTSCFTIERRVTLKYTLPYPSADRFSNRKGVLCAFNRRSCEKLGAKCPRPMRCCTCECRGHNPNFFSLELGCQSTYSLGTRTGKTIVFTYKFYLNNMSRQQLRQMSNLYLILF